MRFMLVASRNECPGASFSRTAADGMLLLRIYILAASGQQLRGVSASNITITL